MLDVHEAPAGSPDVAARPGGGAPPVGKRPLLVGLKRGISRHCPTCGEGPLFRSYLAIREQCPVCGADNGRYPSDDAPPYVTIFLIGHLTAPPILWFVISSTWSVGAILAIFVPLIMVLSALVLPIAKGAVVGLEWSWDVVRPESRAAETAAAGDMMAGSGAAILDDRAAL